MHKNKKRNKMIKILKDSQNRFTAISPTYYSKIRKKSSSFLPPAVRGVFGNDEL
jgi:hypothetical protein